MNAEKVAHDAEGDQIFEWAKARLSYYVDGARAALADGHTARKVWSAAHIAARRDTNDVVAATLFAAAVVRLAEAELVAAGKETT